VPQVRAAPGEDPRPGRREAESRPGRGAEARPRRRPGRGAGPAGCRAAPHKVRARANCDSAAA
ncbi:hypothetical protein ACWGQT_23460, partial [Streptomyces yangpuensis]